MFRVSLPARDLTHDCLSSRAPARLSVLDPARPPLLHILWLVYLEKHPGCLAGSYLSTIWVSPVFSPLTLADPDCSDAPSPYAELSLPALSTAQPYDISLRLVLPASDANFALGNFMASLSLSTPSNKTLVAVSRPVCSSPSLYISLFSPSRGYCTSPQACCFLVLRRPPRH